jgi:hypothetical protein
MRKDSAFVRGATMEAFTTFEDLKLLDSVSVRGLQYRVFPLPNLDDDQTLITIVSDREGKNLLPWEERYLNYRVALVGLTDKRVDPEALRLLNAKGDVTSPQTWAALESDKKNDQTNDMLALWNNWEPVEYENQQRFRWISNDAELLFLHPTEKNHTLNVMLSTGPTFPAEEANLFVEVNGICVDTVSVSGYQRLRVKLPGKLPAESVIRLHLDRTATPTGDDPRTLSLRVYRVFLSEN